MKSWEELKTLGAGSAARSLSDLYRRFHDAATSGYVRRGWKGLTLSHVLFLTQLDEAGTRLSDVAASLGTTKQYSGKLAKEMSAEGLVTLAGDPADRRAVLAVPTEKGRAFLEDACLVKDEIEASFLGKLRPENAAVFLSCLQDLAR